MEEPYYAQCTVNNEKMIKGDYEKLKYCEHKVRPEKCSNCLFSQRLQTLG